MKQLPITALILLLGLLPVAVAKAQQEPSNEVAQTPAKPAGPTIDQVQTQIKAIQDASELEEGLKTKLLETYTRALQELQAAEKERKRFKELKDDAEAAPAMLQEKKAQLAQPAPESKPQFPPDITLAQLDGELAKARALLNDKDDALKNLEAEVARRGERRQQNPKELDAANDELEEIQKQLAAKPAPDEPAQMVAANRTLLQARKMRVEAAVAALEQEPITYTARAELIIVRRDLAKRERDQQAQRVKDIESTANKRRQQEADEDTRKARIAAALADQPVLKRLADENTVLAERRASLASKIKQATGEVERLRNKRTALESDYKKVADKEEKVGLTEVIGVLLRRQRATLPDLSQHRRSIREREAETAQADLHLIEYQEQRSELADIDKLVEEKLEELAKSISPDERDVLKSKLKPLLQTKRDYLDSLINDSNTYLEQLGELDTSERQLVATTDEFRAYIDERIFWVRSTSPLRLWPSSAAPKLIPPDVSAAVEALGWITNPTQWADVEVILVSDALDYPLLFGLAILGAVLLLATQHRRRVAVRAVGEEASKAYATSLVPTVKALGLTVLLTLPWPLILCFIGWRLVAAQGSPFSGTVGSALLAMAAVLFSLEFCRQVCRPKGLGDAHFDWPPAALRVLRGTVWQLMVIGLPLGFVIAALEWQPEDARQDSLGRIAFVAAMLVLAWELRRVLRPGGSVLQPVLANNRGGWLDRLRYLWYPVGVGLPVLLAALALWGYYYTALQLAWRFLMTLWLVVGLLLLMSLTLRWLLLTHRALAIKQARERRAAQAEAKEAGATPEAEGLPAMMATEPELDLTAVSAQSRKLLHVAVVVVLLVGGGLIWADVFPAFGFLRRVELWPYTVTGPDGSTTHESINLAHLLLAVAVALVTFAAAKNLPGLLEITVLQHLPMEPGARFAVSTVSKYLITVVGIVAAFALIGIGWNQVQWLVAAMTVGLGFGLQEIFANFVSGLILLFERPIRVGDIVTVGEVTGKVTRIRIRATTITDWDLRELVVPNKEFVTGQIINWTLSDTLSRMTISVGVAYGSDTALTYKLLLKVADEHPLVLKTPPPHALFDGFGDSTLNFTLRVYMATRDVYLRLRHEIHMAIDNAFREAGIEIAFPQRDLHIRSFEQPVAIAENHRGTTDGPDTQQRDQAASKPVRNL